MAAILSREGDELKKTEGNNIDTDLFSFKYSRSRPHYEQFEEGSYKNSLPGLSKCVYCYE